MTARRLLSGAAALGLLLTGRPLAAQEQLHVVVQYLAGMNVYLNAGSTAGIRAGDTLNVRRLPTNESLTGFVVVTSTPDRSVVAFLGAPYSLTRGDSLAVIVIHARGEVAAPVVAIPTPLGESGRTVTTRRVVTTDGSLSFDMDLLHTTTTGVGGDPEKSTRSFTTPSLGLRYRAQGLGGGWEFRTSLRATQRSSTGDVVSPATLVQVYEATLERRGRGGSLQLGRFYNPYENFSGYWDGMMVHRGGDARGAGLLAGFEPSRGNAGFATTEPKVGAFAHLRTTRPGVRYRTEVALDILFPKDTTGKHLIAGWGQALQLGNTVVSNTIQADRSPLSGTWGVSRWQARLSTRLGANGTIYTGYSLNQLNLGDTTTGVVPYRRDQVNVGFNLWSGGTGFSADLSTSRQKGLASQSAYSANASHRSRSASAFGGGLSTMYWTGGGSKGLLVSPMLLRRFGPVDGQFDYQFYRSTTNGVSSTSHAFELGARLPLSAHTQFSFRFRERTGSYLTSSGVYAGLWYGF